MQQSIRYIVMGLLTVFFIAGCSKQPLQEINDAKAAVDSVVSDGAEKYLPGDAKKINDDLNKAIAEVKAQDAQIFKNYKNAKNMLAGVKTEAEAINAKLPIKKEEAKKDAIAAMEDAKAAMGEAKALLEKASQGKGLKEANETVSMEIQNLENSLNELQTQVDREDYPTIATRAAEIRGKAAELSALIQQTPVKAEKKKK